MTRCALCEREIEDPRTVWKQMAGWVSPHGAKGMTQTQPTGKVAHAECITALKQNVAVEQESLVMEGIRGYIEDKQMRASP